MSNLYRLPLLIAVLCAIQAYAQTPSLLDPEIIDDLYLTAVENEEEKEQITLTSLEENPIANDEIPYEALRTFVDVFDNIKKNYIEETSNEVLIENAIRGMIGRLDPHSSFLNEKEFQSFKEQTDGEYIGIGVVLDFQNGAIEIISAIPGSPAQRAGLQSGDIFSTINQQSVQDISLQEAIALLEGVPGSEITLGVLRGDQLINLTLTRERIHTNSVEGAWLAPGLVHLRISQFQEDTADSLKETIERLQQEHDIRGVLLDLRNNPGGYLFSAVDTADLLLDTGIILSVRNREKIEQQQYVAEDGALLSGIPIVVLVNRGTASSAEIVTAALQENHRAVIAGQQTFGKGSVQTVIPLYNGGAIKLTTAKYYTPMGNLIQARGIRPDIILANLNVNPISPKPDESIASEASLYNHIENDEQPENGNREDTSTTDLSASDFMLYEAVNILNTLIIATK